MPNISMPSESNRISQITEGFKSKGAEETKLRPMQGRVISPIPPPVSGTAAKVATQGPTLLKSAARFDDPSVQKKFLSEMKAKLAARDTGTPLGKPALKSKTAAIATPILVPSKKTSAVSDEEKMRAKQPHIFKEMATTEKTLASNQDKYVERLTTDDAKIQLALKNPLKRKTVSEIVLNDPAAVNRVQQNSKALIKLLGKSQQRALLKNSAGKVPSKTEVWAALNTKQKIGLLKQNKIHLGTLHKEQYAHFKEYQGRVASASDKIAEYFEGAQTAIKDNPGKAQSIMKETLSQLTDEDTDIGHTFNEYLEVMKDAAEERKKIEPVLNARTEELKEIWGNENVLDQASIQMAQRLPRWELLLKDFGKNTTDSVLKTNVEKLATAAHAAAMEGNEKLRAYEQSPNKVDRFSTQLFDKVLSGGTKELQTLAADIHRESQRRVGEFDPSILLRYNTGTTKELKEKRAKLESKIQKEESEIAKIELEEDLQQIENDMPLAEKVDDFYEFFNNLSAAIQKNILFQTDAGGAKKAIGAAIKLMTLLYKEGDLNATMALSSALKNASVDRVIVREGMKSEIPKQITKTLSTDSNFKAYHALVHERINTGKPVTPYLGVYMSQITFARDGNNPEKAKEIADFIGAMSAQVQPSTLSGETFVQQELEIVGELRQEGAGSLDKILYDRSLELFPRK